jgi:formylglycine-generating enzyme required for sulfatase activity
MRYCYGNGEAQLGDYAWYGRNATTGTHRVSEKKPNEWGLYDMHGNVWEWCQDAYDPAYYNRSDAKDPNGPGSPWNAQVQRGGSWGFGSFTCRAAFRSYCDPGEVTQHRGFRVVLVSAEPVQTEKVNK